MRVYKQAQGFMHTIAVKLPHQKVRHASVLIRGRKLKTEAELKEYLRENEPETFKRLWSEK